MSKGVILIFLTLINIIIFLVSFVLVFTPYYPYFIAFFVLFLLVYLLIFTFFSRYTNKTMCKQKENLLMISNINIKSLINDKGFIEFEKIDGKWVNKQDTTIVFNLQGYLFQKSFIMAWLIRNIRYKAVSNKLKLIKLLNFKLKIPFYKELKIRFISPKKTKEKIIVLNYISKNTLLTKSINKSRYYKFFGRYSVKTMMEIEFINEKVFLEYYKKY